MENMGQIYVEVDANAANGIMTLAESGGGTPGTYWISWTADGGFTGIGWEVAWNSQNVPLQSAWTAGPADGYNNTYQGFIDYVGSGVSELNQWLDGAGWTSEQKFR